jgi:transposase
MLQLTPQMKVFIAIDPVDFRKGIDGLGGVCRNVLRKNPLDGAVFLFRSRGRRSIKILVYDGQGFWLCTKRLSKGRFRCWPDKDEMFPWELQTLIWNGDPARAQFSSPWQKI